MVWVIRLGVPQVSGLKLRAGLINASKKVMILIDTQSTACELKEMEITKEKGRDACTYQSIC